MSNATFARSLPKLLTLAVTGVALAALTGCAGFQGVQFPEATAVPVASEMGPLTGSVYGGHAPLVGAHVYLVQPGTTGYGSQVTSLLTTSYSATYPLTANGSFSNTTGADQFVPSGFQGVKTDATGQFYITGDYTCTAGLPVILIAYGGSPSYAGAGPNVYTVTNATEVNNGTTGFTFTYTTGSPSPQLFYPGEPVAVTGATGSAVGFNNSGTVIGDATLTTTQFSIFVAYGSNPNLGNGTASNLSLANGGQIATGTPAFNPAAVNLSVLGNCPSPLPMTNLTIAGSASPYTVTVTNSGANNLSPGNAVTFAGLTGAAASLNGLKGRVLSSGLSSTGFSATVTTGNTLTAGSYSTATGTYFAGFNNLNYIYTNEISTTATAYAFAGFTNTSATTQTGYDEFHIGGSGTTQSNQALANAALTAGNLYDIQGSNTAVGNPNGDVHIARTTTPSGNGAVSTTMVNLIGNILAACVDSNNTTQATATVIAGSPQCANLGKFAEDNGVVDLSTTPVLTHRAANIAQAAFNLARFPQGNGTNNAGTVVAGSATTAADFVSGLVGIIGGNAPFTPYLGSTSNTTGINSGGGTNPNDLSVVIGWSNAAADGGTAVSVGDVEADGLGGVWAPASAAGSASALFQYTPSGAVVGYTGLLSPTNAGQIAIDAANNVWAAGTTGSYKFTPGTAAGTLVGALNANASSGIALDSATNQYIANLGRGTTATLVKQSSAGVAAGGNFPQVLPATCIQNLAYIALDASSVVWTATSNPAFNTFASICSYTSAGVNVSNYILPSNGVAGGSHFSIPHYLAIDAGNNAWFADKDYGILYKMASGTSGTTAPAATLVLGAAAADTTTTSTNPIGVAIDGANTVWVTNQNAASGSGGLIQASNAALRLTPGYIAGGPLGSETARPSLGGDSVDISGNLWVSGGTLLYEYVGLATPVAAPKLAARGTKP